MEELNMKDVLEKSAFGVCTYIGEKVGIATSRVRLYFIYLSCATLGSSMILYLFMAFWVNIRKSLKRNDRTAWE
ncbi:MAG: PspC family transcriptional regulator [Saprospiraceae bacterium]|jgi:phage shock protein PspC (stress-responsive transcriptional regulator)|nr:MAG: PspC family transcriptional regulator [Candidatus Parvibacillus calidus]MBX2937463.1 PspC family transcriptional regulator [Saprospiraceae bacterium]MBK7741996.1 PspC family transcriptional regulator [Candidatus Parvibacillus calidus]MBX7178941.1 PspC family transcriptional regulator [Saprospiraceae bacterium]MCB0589849.1 PspC family transcriptional regulator [Saprospiraceae bacterium]